MDEEQKQYDKIKNEAYELLDGLLIELCGKGIRDLPTEQFRIISEYNKMLIEAGGIASALAVAKHHQ